ncbi:MAG: heparan-alpha-glucosaminide N-acetyltransferase [Thermoleophilia bacterium]|nr:heparan-alpha-glucosaminide N-acetyltransferase [Thermoleophilia bacterium]
MSKAGGARARFWEVDAARGLAIVAMVIFHAAWDWAYFADTDLGEASSYFSGPIAGAFILLLGLSVSLDRDRTRAARRSEAGRAAYRVALIGGAAGLVTLGTWVALPESFVYFGILHLLAACTLVLAFTARLGAVVNALLGVALLAIGWSGLLDGPAPQPWLAILGWDAPRATVDWYPLTPWAGFALLGFAVGRTWYADGARRFSPPDWERRTAWLGSLGRHSLLIYLTHQLVLFPLVWLLAAVLS